jgi:hypothetical protein
MYPHRAVKMSILALYYRIGYGKQGLPWIVQSGAVWATAGFITAFSLAVFLVSNHLSSLNDEFNSASCTGPGIRLSPRIPRLGHRSPPRQLF